VVEAHTILSAAWTPGDELTETLKPRRGRIMDKYAAEIDAMDRAKPHTTAVRRVSWATRSVNCSRPCTSLNGTSADVNESVGRRSMLGTSGASCRGATITEQGGAGGELNQGCPASRGYVHPVWGGGRRRDGGKARDRQVV
jgi:hypothetical protein